MPGGGRTDSGDENKPSSLREHEEDWVLARRGIHLVLNNQYAQAQQLFSDKRDSIQLAAGHCYIVFMNAVMTFEEEMLDEATNLLRDLEKRCAQDLGWLKTVRNKVFGNGKEKSEAACLEEQIILADCQVCSALLSLMLHDTKAGYVRGGWALRKAWRLYQHTYTTLLQLYRQAFGIDSHVPGSEVPSWRVITRGTGMTPDSPSCPWTLPSSANSSIQTLVTPSPSSAAASPLNGYRNPFAAFFSSGSGHTTPQPKVEPSEVARLMSAISFGYGLFHLCVSLLPNTLLRVIQLLGFAGDRIVGLEALMFARQGPDMRAPLASLALLWYHTIVRPFFAVDGHNVNAGVEAASRLIEESQKDFSDSALFLFFRGKIHRLKNDIDGAVSVYSCAVEKSPQREIQLLCLHEVGWCRLIQLDYALAYSAFLQLKHSALWGKPFYAYLTAVCAGAIGDTKVVVKLMPKLLGVLKTEEPLHKIIRNRALLLDTQSPPYFRLMVYELLYLWNDLHSTRQTRAIIEDCNSFTDCEEPMVGLRSLIKGVCYIVEGEDEEAASALRSVLVERSAEDIQEHEPHQHIPAFAHYELATLLLKDPQKVEEGKRLLQNAQTSYKDYDFENRLSIRMHTALRQASNN